MNNRKIIYTESGKIRAEKFHKDITEDIEEYLLERKLIPGDDFIEVTASDIDEIVRNFKIRRYNKSTSIKAVLPIFYTILGIMLIAVGLLYDEFLILVTSNPQRLILIISGFTMIFFSWVYSSLNKSLEIGEQIDRHRQEIELRRNVLKKDDE